MQVKQTQKTPTTVTLHIEAGAAELAPYKKRALQKLASQVKVTGFRAGKAPLHIVEQQVGRQQLLDEFMTASLDDLYQKALGETRLRVVGSPQAELKKFVPFTQLTFDVTTDVIGPIKLPSYKTIRKAMPTTVVTDKEVNSVVDSLRDRQAKKTEVKRAAKKGDEIILDFKGKDKAGKPVAGAEGKDYPLTLGSDTFIPGFEQHLIGLKGGEDKTFIIKFPADYGVSALRSKDVTFVVKVKTVNELERPEADDAFAKSVGPFESLSALKSDIKTQLLNENQQQALRNYENELLSDLIGKTQVEIPEFVVDEQLQAMEEDERRNLAYRGQTWQEHLEAEGITEKQHRDRQRGGARDRVKSSLMLSEIADKEQLMVTPEELDIRLTLLKNQHTDPQMRAQLDTPQGKSEIASRLLAEKTIAKLVDYASKKLSQKVKKT